MTIREMEIFLTIVEYKTMRKAAEVLFISQPTISGTISSIEAELGTELFERLGKKLYITPSGEQLALYAQKILYLHQEMTDSLTSDDNTRLRIGATISIGGKLLNSILQKWPYTQPFVQITNTQEIERKLLSAKLDCAIVEGSIHSSDLVAIPMFEDTLYVFCSQHHPFAKLSYVTLSHLQGEYLILREQGSGTRELTLDILNKNKIEYTALWESNSIEAIIEAVKNNIGITIMSDKLWPEHSSLRKIPITDCNFNRIFQFIYRKDKFITHIFQEFLTICENMSDC